MTNVNVHPNVRKLGEIDTEECKDDAENGNLASLIVFAGMRDTEEDEERDRE
jgi:hypothetical protein